MDKSNSQGAGNDSRGNFLKYDPLFAQIYFTRHSIWEHLEP